MSGILNAIAGSIIPISQGPSVAYTNALLASGTTHYYVVYETVGNFTNDFTVSNTNLTADILVIAGGGSGYSLVVGPPFAGGGGAGGVVSFTNQSLFGTYSIIVGDGGADPTSTVTVGNNGQNSRFGNFTTAIGGGGGGVTVAGANGGSGGGGGSTVATGGTPASGQGFAGGTGRTGGSASARSGGGGGGASAVGGNSSANIGGVGGNGTSSFTSWFSDINSSLNRSYGEISSSLIYVAGGGAGSGSSAIAESGLGGATLELDSRIHLGAGGSSIDGSAPGFNFPLTNGTQGIVIIRYTRSQVGG